MPGFFGESSLGVSAASTVTAAGGSANGAGGGGGALGQDCASGAGGGYGTAGTAGKAGTNGGCTVGGIDPGGIAGGVAGVADLTGNFRFGGAGRRSADRTRTARSRAPAATVAARS